MSDRSTDSRAAEEQQVTRLLKEAQHGGSEAAKALLPLVYARLRQLAEQRMAGERPGHTLQATALVHEAYVRLVGAEPVPWAGRSHFFFAAAEAMRRILIDHARARAGPRRGGKRRRVAFSNVLDLAQAAEEDLSQILILDEAISRLEKVSESAAAVVRLRFFAGLSVEETAAALNVSAPTVKRNWTYARAWLSRELKGDD